MNGIDLDSHYAPPARAAVWTGRTHRERTLRRYHNHSPRRDHGCRLTRLAVIHTYRTVAEGGSREVSTNAFRKRVGRWYHHLRAIEQIPFHVRPSLTTKCMERLTAFVCGLPQDIRYTDALEGVLTYCIEYKESKLERWYREHPTASEGLVDPPDIPEGW